jgi:ABC-type polysaccharide/polyol phosphate transport system ATPase subunit
VAQAIALSAQRLGVRYNLRLTRKRTLREAMSHRLRARRTGEEREFWALKDVTFLLAPGEILGVIGRNGSGKSTLLLTIAGILQPDAGGISVAGRTSALMTIGAGFEPELTGRQNIYLNGAYLGLAHRTIRELENAIVEFADLGDFIDASVRTYSIGMRSRLGFAIASHIDPDILLLDEVISAGDLEFQAKSKAKIETLIERARSIVVVSHDTKFVSETCTKVLWLHEGGVRAFGSPEEIVPAYVDFFREQAGPAGSLEPLRAVHTQAQVQTLGRSRPSR